jgi:hypothetical protein
MRLWTTLAALFLTAAPTYTACGDFTVSANLLKLPGSVTLQVDVDCLSDSSVVRVFNDAREQVKVLPVALPLPAPPALVPFVWDGRNEAGDDCATGVYVLHLTGSPNAGVRRIAVVR